MEHFQNMQCLQNMDNFVALGVMFMLMHLKCNQLNFSIINEE